VLIAIGVVQTGLDERRLGFRGVWVGHHSEIAFSFVEDVAQPGGVEDAALAQLGVEVIVGQSTHPHLAAAQLAVVDKDPDPVVEQLAGHRAKPQQAGEPVHAMRVSSATAPVA
jgi:hypothetical protein